MAHPPRNKAWDCSALGYTAMKTSLSAFAVTSTSLCLLAALPAFGASSLTEKLFDTDGSIADGISGTTGLGSATVIVGGSGAKKSYLFLDLELSLLQNTFFNETGGVGGNAKPAALSYEIDEPGYADAPDGPGDIYSNFGVNALDNAVFKVGASTLPQPNDVSVAFGWDFSLLAGEVAYISYLVTKDLQAVGTRFYLTHSDPDSDEVLYIATGIDIRQGGGDVVVPETNTVVGASALAALVGFGAWRRRQQRTIAAA